MIILWTKNDEPFVAAYSGKHSIEEISLELCRRNIEMKNTLGRLVYTYASNESNQHITHDILMECVGDYKKAMSKKTDIKSQLEKLF